MKLLLDENLPRSLVAQLEVSFPGTAHISQFHLLHSTDEAIWQFAREHQFAILTRDDDFIELGFLRGSPPKIIWLNRANPSVRQLKKLLSDGQTLIRLFLESDNESSVLILPQSPS